LGGWGVKKAFLNNPVWDGVRKNNFYENHELNGIELCIFINIYTCSVMENKKYNDVAGENRSNELPLHFRLMDVYLEQVERSVPLLTTMVKDMQSVYVNGAKMALKAGEMLEERSKLNVDFFRSAGKTLESITPVISETQLGFTRALVDSLCRGIRLMRENMTESK